MRTTSYWGAQCCLVLLIASVGRAADVEPLSLGAAAPNFKLPGTDGQEYSLDSFRDAKLLMVIFICNHCPTAQAYEARIKKLHQDYHERGVALVAISPNDPKAVRLDELGYTDLGDTLEEMKLRAERVGFEFPYLFDGETQEASRQFGALATPHVFIFDQDRKLRYAGRIDDNDIKPPKSHDARRALDELLAGKPVSRPETRVFGCSTKWSDKRDSAKVALEKWNCETAELEVLKPDQLAKRLSQAGKFRLVNVWATWCAPCVEEMDDLVTMHRMYRKRNFELITISADEVTQQEAALKVLNEKHCSATNVILDAESRDDLFDSVDPKWKGAVPYTMLVSPEGKVIHRVHGSFDADELKQVIADALGRTYASKTQ